MSKMIWLIDHGSRDRDGIAEFLHFAAAVEAAQVQFPETEIIPAGHLGGHRHELAIVGDRLVEALALRRERRYA